MAELDRERNTAPLVKEMLGWLLPAAIFVGVVGALTRADIAAPPQPAASAGAILVKRDVLHETLQARATTVLYEKPLRPYWFPWYNNPAEIGLAPSEHKGARSGRKGNQHRPAPTGMAARDHDRRARNSRVAPIGHPARRAGGTAQRMETRPDH